MGHRAAVPVCVLVLNTSFGRWFFVQVNDAVIALLAFAEEGGRFLFGEMVRNNIRRTPAAIRSGSHPGAHRIRPHGPSSLSACCHHRLLRLPLCCPVSHAHPHLGGARIAWVMQRSMKTSGAETLSSAREYLLGRANRVMVRIPRGATLSE